MKMYIIFTILVVIEIIAAGSIGADKYQAYFRNGKTGAKRIFSETTVRASIAVMAITTVTLSWGLLSGLTEINFANYDQILAAIIGIFAIYLWWTTIESMESNNLESVMDLLELFAPVVTMIALLLLIATVRYFATLDCYSPTIIVMLLGTCWCYYKALYRVSVIGGNLRLLKIE